jgi:tetratricopeptide (TPR) repeat protein
MMLFSHSKKSNIAPVDAEHHTTENVLSKKTGAAGLTSSSRASRCSNASSTGSTTTTMLSQHIFPLPRGTTKEELETFANECTVAAYDLVWHQGDYNQALSCLHKALDVQRSYLGKHHKEVGYTCNFIATAYWLQEQDLNAAMRYFLEARRIFCKTVAANAPTSFGTICTTSPLLSGIDERIHCLLLRFELPPEDIERAKQAIDRTIGHELQGDRFKSQGLIQAARDEYKRARKVAGVLRQLM